jgi:hypothetical protein
MISQINSFPPYPSIHLPSIVVSLAAAAGWVATDPFHDFPD